MTTARTLRSSYSECLCSTPGMWYIPFSAMRDMLCRSSRRTSFPSDISLYHGRPRTARISPASRIRPACVPTDCTGSTIGSEGPSQTVGPHIAERLIPVPLKLLIAACPGSGTLLLGTPASSLRPACVPALSGRVANGSRFSGGLG
jgi:hypothetical protein